MNVTVTREVNYIYQCPYYCKSYTWNLCKHPAAQHPHCLSLCADSGNTQVPIHCPELNKEEESNDN